MPSQGTFSARHNTGNKLINIRKSALPEACDAVYCVSGNGMAPIIRDGDLILVAFEKQLKSWLSFTASSSASTIKICQTKNFAGSFGFYKNQRKQELLSVKGKNGKEKPLLHGCVCFHVAAVGAILIQLKFQSDKVEFILEITAMLF